MPPDEFIPIAEHSGLIIRSANMCCASACLDGRHGRASRSRSMFRRCSSAGSISSRMVERIAYGNRIRSGAARARADRKHAARQRRQRGGRDAAAEGAGRQARARRFRHRLFEPAVSAPLPVRQAQDRPELRAVDREGRRRRRDRARGGQPRPRAWHEGHGRGRGNRRAASVPARRRRALHARFPLRQADPSRRRSPRGSPTPGVYRSIEGDAERRAARADADRLSRS